VNYHLFELINSAAGRIDWLDDLLEFAATWLIYGVFALAAVVVAVAVRHRRLSEVIEVGAALVLAFLTATLLAHLSHELRPFQSHPVHQLIAHGGGISLPSDHATAAFTLAFAVGAFLDRTWGMILVAAAVVIGFARVWAGLHYPGDILAAAIIAALAVLEVWVASRWRDALMRDGSAGMTRRPARPAELPPGSAG
jgi:undecaprenyl-diphosphatase